MFPFYSLSLSLHVCLHHSHTHAFILFYLIRVPIGCHICVSARREQMGLSSCTLLPVWWVLRPLRQGIVSIWRETLGLWGAQRLLPDLWREDSLQPHI